MNECNTLGKIEDSKLTIFSNNCTYKIYDIAFMELKYEEIKIRYYLFFMFSILNYIIYLNFSVTEFLDFFYVSLILFCFSFSFHFNPKKYRLQLSFKNYKIVMVSIKKKELTDAEFLIEEFNKAYKKIDLIIISEK